MSEWRGGGRNGCAMLDEVGRKGGGGGSDDGGQGWRWEKRIEKLHEDWPRWEEWLDGG